MGVHDHVREMKHTERTLVFPSSTVQKLTGECFSTTISGFVWVNDWLKFALNTIQTIPEITAPKACNHFLACEQQTHFRSSLLSP